MSDDFIVYTLAALIVIIGFLTVLCIVVGEVRLLFWLFEM